MQNRSNLVALSYRCVHFSPFDSISATSPGTSEGTLCCTSFVCLTEKCKLPVPGWAHRYTASCLNLRLELPPRMCDCPLYPRHLVPCHALASLLAHRSGIATRFWRISVSPRDHYADDTILAVFGGRYCIHICASEVLAHQAMAQWFLVTHTCFELSVSRCPRRGSLVPLPDSPWQTHLLKKLRGRRRQVGGRGGWALDTAP